MEILDAEIKAMGDTAELHLKVRCDDIPRLSSKLKHFKKYEVGVFPKRDSNSKQSINYLWAKVEELADMQTNMGVVVSKDEVFDDLIRQYGQSEIFEIDAKEIVLSLKEIYRIVDVLGERNGKYIVRCYRGITRLDKNEIKVLVDGVKYEIKQLYD